MGVGDGNYLDAGLLEVLEGADGARFGIKTKAAESEDLDGVLVHFVLFGELEQEVLTGGEEDIIGGAVFDLAGQRAGTGERECEIGGGEELAKLWLKRAQIRSSGDRQLRFTARRQILRSDT